MQKFDIVINGGGIVGLALACGLQQNNLQIAVIEDQTLQSLLSVHNSTLRVSAINAASRRLLQYLQVWNEITTQGANPYRKIEVWNQSSYVKISFDSCQLGYQQLGHIIENTVIQKALLHRISQLSNVTLFTSISLKNITWYEHEVLMTLNDDRRLTARLVVAADGANSWLREYVNIPITFWDYQHYALVATVRTERPHENIARQAFHHNGILAFLPLIDPYLNSIVWSLHSDLAQQLLVQSDANFNIALAKNLNLALGLCQLQGKCHKFAISIRYARSFAAHRLVLVGDAAHTIHPLAGQGVNLGLMDVAELISQIQQLNKTDKDIGNYSYWRHYERNRKYSAAQMLTGIECFRQLFCGNHLSIKLLRGIGLRLVDRIPGIKQIFLNKAIGLNDMPAWLSMIDYD
ncbi:FAD-dependent monooxygenase [Candidatus Palibaumannia cicadellinicola]|uniref:FAD-dependent monooxygenase n=1 Tax=Candidatus Palibaumannia cicadellinicola TaxID=186490 RepID=UPI000570AA78|nr:FAD-dependent monooxygenase [Candidatus Baumannia cicadellinicola]